MSAVYLYFSAWLSMKEKLVITVASFNQFRWNGGEFKDKYILNSFLENRHTIGEAKTIGTLRKASF